MTQNPKIGISIESLQADGLTRKVANAIRRVIRASLSRAGGTVEVKGWPISVMGHTVFMADSGEEALGLFAKAAAYASARMVPWPM
jgi:hypothetical protein